MPVRGTPRAISQRELVPVSIGSHRRASGAPGGSRREVRSGVGLRGRARLDPSGEGDGAGTARRRRKNGCGRAATSPGGRRRNWARGIAPFCCAAPARRSMPAGTKMRFSSMTCWCVAAAAVISAGCGGPTCTCCGATPKRRCGFSTSLQPTPSTTCGARVTRARALLGAKRFEAAVPLLESVVSRAPDNADFARLLFRAWKGAGCEAQLTAPADLVPCPRRHRGEAALAAGARRGAAGARPARRGGGGVWRIAGCRSRFRRRSTRAGAACDAPRVLGRSA